MLRCSLVRVGLSILVLVALVARVLAGGFAVVTLDELPQEPRAGQTLQLGFMVRMHGVTPIDSLGSGSSRIPLRPYLSAWNRDTGALLRVDARKDGPVGHFVVDVTFPSAGTWEWEISPHLDSLPAMKLGQLTVLPAAPTSMEPATNGIEAIAPAFSRSTLRWTGALMVLAAAMLALLSRREAPGRQRALGQREAG